MSHQAAASVQRQHAPAVLAGHVQVAGRSAVIIVADEPNAFTGLRRRLIPLLRVPGRASPGDLAHITLFRYARPPGDPAALLGWLAATECCLGIDVSELLIIQERVFPCLDYEILHRLPLAPALPADTCEPVSLRARNERPGETSARQVKG